MNADANKPTSCHVEALKPDVGKMTKFGATVTGLDLNKISDEEISYLRHLVWQYKLLIIKRQPHLEPIKQWNLITRLDPEAEPQSPELFLKDFHPEAEGFLKARGVTGVPGAENVHVIGKGYIGDHCGLKNLNLNKSFSYENHEPPLPATDLEMGHVRFQGWHFDAPMYNRHPPMFTAFHVIKLPTGPDVNIRWDDGSGQTMSSPPGMTPFFCCSQLYEDLLTDEERQVVDHSWVEYAALPYEWNRNCKVVPTGLGLVSQGKELSEEQVYAMGADDTKIMKYPMVWVNSQTGRRSFVVQTNAAKKLFLRSRPDQEHRVIDDLKEVRKFLLNLQSRILKPEYILNPPEEEGDVLLWDNWSTMHTRVDYPALYGSKVCHQAGANASKCPMGPSPICV